MSELTIGFDLDMTLIDSRPGIRAAHHELTQQTGVYIDADHAVSRLGPPLKDELANWFPAAHVDEMSDRYRDLYPEFALPLIEALPGAAEALIAARKNGRAIITAKFEVNARLHVERLGLEADRIYGGAWRMAKADVLRAEGAGIYVGDHIHDMNAADGAGAIGVGVATGPCSPEELREHGAAVVLNSLREFPDYLEEELAAQAGRA